MPTRSFIVCCSSWCSVYGFSAAVGLLRTAPSASLGAAVAAPRRATVRPVGHRGRPTYRRRPRQPGPAAEHQQVGQRVAAEPVGAVHAAGDLTGREQARHRGRGGVRLDLDAAHHVVAGRPDLHRLGGDVDVGQLLELVVHRRQPPADLLGGQPAWTTSRKTPPCGEPRPALTSELIARATSSRGSSSGGRRLLSGSAYQRSPSSSVSAYCSLEDVGDVVEHEPLALGVAQHAAVAADRLGDEDALDRRRPDHAGRVELHELHVDQRRARRAAPARGRRRCTPRSSSHLERLADAAGGQHDGRGLEERRTARTRASSRRRRRSALAVLAAARVTVHSWKTLSRAS